ncbi:Calcium permeable stress-gated cation channel-like protein [Hapsidospora chrysogenum ATCC 11550]|uniref:Calcium permeable stress-gated cation channel-like protein n=1 Tax=Hapsidospora chrysogenum (strain ATCC 11550 / CBS 779.69 / DSM 880 / IAM 14645 / JCM 23072 / IMI 49137) TaxID=857340 RepID=A0A086TH88_HAPC1|nr:Calcium permeable stress-gated cation channel-like protein [Hapsidospora chrysogenum ATCC 11550]
MFGSRDGECDPEEYVRPPSKDRKDIGVQLVLSLIIGVSALVTFCILRPRWPALYAARKRRLEPKIKLPELPTTFLGWMPKLYRITEQEVLATAGLDAFVFLNFFKMAIRLFALMAFFAIVVLLPINNKFAGFDLSFGGNDTDTNRSMIENDFAYDPFQLNLDDTFDVMKKGKGGHKDKSRESTFLWAYVVFTYFFVAMTIYSVNLETFRIIKFRQDYLGTQSTVTDRTFRLTGIPSDLRSEARIKRLIEKLEIGTVTSVTLCRDWREIDDLVEERNRVLRQLEASWARFMKSQHAYKAGQRFDEQSTPSGNGSGTHVDEEAGENVRLLEENTLNPHLMEGDRPQMTIRYGILKLRSRKVDAIDYYEEKLRRLDDRIITARKKEYRPTDMALVTMDSVASCQMVTQARIDPRPGRLLTKSTPAPSDLVWRNTYALRGIRRLKSWVITIFITILTLVWIFPTAFLASLLSICTVKKVAPTFSDWLNQHSIIYSLFANGMPTLIVSLLNVAVPYLYDFLSNHQGMISQGDVELSIISKNFFFTFFNTFFVFAISRTGFNFWSTLQEWMQNTSLIARAIAADVEELSIFYISFIILQGIGLMPFRLLEVGSVVLYPIYRMTSATPRDFAELQQPPTFQYGFYLPTALLVFNLCLIYSVLRWGFAILIFGTVYFILGYFTFKYMVMYAMDQPQHATGGAWRIICYRIIVGLLVFEVVMVGQIASAPAWVQSAFILPLIPFTIWYSYYFGQRFDPLTRYIALRAIRSDEDEVDAGAVENAFADEDGPRPSQGILRRDSTLDEFKERGMRFVNPSLVVPLVQPWVYDDPPPPLPEEESGTEESRQASLIVPSTDSSLGIGEANVWRDTDENNI